MTCFEYLVSSWKVLMMTSSVLIVRKSEFTAKVELGWSSPATFLFWFA